MKSFHVCPWLFCVIVLLGPACAMQDDEEELVEGQVNDTTQALLSTISSYTNTSNTVLADVNGKKTVGTAGGLHSVWALNGSVYYASSANGTVWTAPIMLDAAASKTPAIAATSDGRIAVVYVRGNEIYYRSKPLNGVWGTAFRVTSDSTSQVAGEPTIATYANDVHLAWNRGSVYYATFPAAQSGPLTTASRISKSSMGSFPGPGPIYVYSASHPSIAVSNSLTPGVPVVRVAWWAEEGNLELYYGVTVAEKPATPMPEWPVVTTNVSWPLYTPELHSLSLAANRTTGDFYLAHSYVEGAYRSTWLLHENAQNPNDSWQWAQILPRESVIDVAAASESNQPKIRIAYSDFTQGSNGYGPTYYRTGQWTSGAAPTWDTPDTSISNAGRMGTTFFWKHFTKKTLNDCHALFETWSTANNYSLVDSCNSRQRVFPRPVAHLNPASSDLTVRRPSLNRFETISADKKSKDSAVFGSLGDIPVDGDFDGDGKSDYALWSPTTGTWDILQTSTKNHVIRQWGTSGDVPLSGDFDGDGKTDISVWRPSQTKFYTIRSSDNNVAGGVVFGVATDIPVNGDFDGDWKADWALFRPSTGTWDILQSSTGTHVIRQWGTSGDVPLSGDFDGDGKTDISVWRPSQTKFYTIRSSDNQIAGGVVFGAATDVPVTGDFDGDEKTDWALFRPSNGTWDILQSSTMTHVAYQWGAHGDTAVPRPQK